MGSSQRIVHANKFIAMRILVITEYYRNSFANGSEVFAFLLIEELKRKHDITLLAHATNDALPGLNIAISDDVYQSVDELKDFLATHVNPYEYDVIYNLGALHFGCFIVKYLRELFTELTIVNHFQILFGAYAQVEKMSAAKQKLLSKPQIEAATGAALNIFVSVNELCKAYQLGFQLSSSVAVINNGVDVKNNFVEKSEPPFTVPLINGRKPLVFLASGRFSDHSKGADIAFRAFRRLVHDKKEVYLVAIGHTEKYKFLLNDTPRENYVLLNWQSRSELSKFFLIADVMLVPSRYEPFGMIAVEGMLAGLPVIANDTGGLSEIIDHQKNGLLNRAGNGWLGFYQCMLELALSPERVPAMGQEAKATAIKKYNIEDIGMEVDKHLCRASISHKVLETNYINKKQSTYDL
jgi:glycosyltransferase involved in cell wall biosynthesis